MGSKTFGYLFFIFAFFIFIIIILYDNIKSSGIEEAHKMFYFEEVSGIVHDISQNRGSIRLRLEKNPNQKYYFGVSRNYKLNPYDVERFINKGDSIYKPRKSDKLKVFRNGNEYFFMIDKSINKDYR